MQRYGLELLAGSSSPTRRRGIGKEVDRLATDEGAWLGPDQPLEYGGDGLAEDIAYLVQFPQEPTARDLGLTVRGWRNLVKSRSKPRVATADQIVRLAAAKRLLRVVAAVAVLVCVGPTAFGKRLRIVRIHRALISVSNVVFFSPVVSCLMP